MSSFQNFVTPIRLVKILVALVLFCGIIFVQQSPSFSSESKPVESNSQNADSRVVIIAIPRVTWKLLNEAKTPNIDELIKTGSVASLSIRTQQKDRSIEKGYASISAGNRSYAASSDVSTFYSPDEVVGSGNSLDVFNRERGDAPKDASALALGFQKTVSRNSNSLIPSEVGAFATALEQAGKSVAVFGNADTCQTDISRCAQRSVGYLGTNVDGVVRYGDLSQDLLRADRTLDMGIIREKAIDSIKQHEVTAVECSNIERAEIAKKRSVSKIANSQFLESIKECDDLVGQLSSQLDFSRDRMLIISPVSPLSKEQLTVFIANGKGIDPGYATSGITRREGIVALADIAPSVLDFFQVEPPDSMIQSLLGWEKSGDSVSEKKAALVKTNDRVLARDGSFTLVATVFIFLAFITVVISVLAYKKFPTLKPVATLLCFISMVMPTITFLMLPFMLTLSTSLNIVLVFSLLSLLIGVLSYYLAQKFGKVLVILAIAAVTLLVQIADIISGGNLQFNSLFGYSSIIAGRFAGYGNMAFAIVAMSCVVVVAMVKQLSVSHPGWNMKLVNLGLIFLLVLVLVVDGMPYFGSDVGGVLALTPMVFVVGLMLYEKRVTLKSILLATFLTVVSISIFSLFDLTRPISERTHLGRFVEVLIDGRAGVVIERKIVANYHTLTNSVTASVIILTTLYLIVLFLNPERFIKSVPANYPAIRYIAIPGLITGMLGMLLNDSGVAIPGMMIAIGFPACALLAFEFKQKNQSNTTSVDQTV